MLRRLAVFALVSLAVPVLAQQYGESIEVRVVNIDAVVTDRSGNPIRGLTKDDFEIFENGKKKEISNFLAVEETAAGLATPEGRQQLAAQAQPAARRHIVVFVDQSTLMPANRSQVAPALKGFLQQAMRPGDEVTLFTWSPGLNMELPFTADRAAAAAALDRIAKQATPGTDQQIRLKRAQDEIARMPNDWDAVVNAAEGRRVSAQPVDEVPALQGVSTKKKPPYERGLAAARTFAEQVTFDMRRKTEAVKGVIGQMKSFEGKKLFVFLTQSFSTAEAKQIFEYLDSMKDAFENGQNQNPRLDGAAFDDGPMLQDVISTANASGVTLYPISASGKFSGVEFNDASVGATAFNEGQGRINRMQFVDQPLQQIAGATGGVALTGSSDFKSGFDRILGDLTTYYSLGYRADAEPHDAVRKIEVRLKKKQPYLVRTREAYVDRSVASEMTDAVMANLIYPVSRNDLKITVSAGAPAPGAGDDVTVPVDVKVPTAALTLVPEGADLTGKISVYAAFFRRDGATSKVTKQEFPIRFPAASLARRKELTVKLAITTHKATDAISVGVMDEVAHATGFGTAKVGS